LASHAPRHAASDHAEELLMKVAVISSIVALAVLGGAGGAFAQASSPGNERQPPAKQSAPAEAPQASGHDAQTGQPETGPNATQAQNPATKHDVDGDKTKANPPAERK
jgi:hypothetical protein